ncbi:hypothetical protein K469DRAFT_705354 [Zopfia rhizophila CBS 207.26]|uniref:Uncharacterized protein n=1 Tax=Zopfia rhizophila CBS 207.26 TaxID=1314779 RepID=A0A6A6E6P2_9PEZI|nr:hypothetical protein K469DRAFT_705354 [Zopfia rhizophila CBS 207.26]
MNPDVKILVHISASFTRQNDDLYRSLADAYFDFKPHQRESTEGLEATKQPEGPLQIVTTSEDSYGSFPSFVSPAKQRKSPEITIVRPFSESGEALTQQRSRLEQLDRIQARWRRPKDLNSSAVLAKRKSTDQIYTSSGNKSTIFIEDTQLAAQALESQLHENLSTTSEDTSEDEIGTAPQNDNEVPPRSSISRTEDILPSRNLVEVPSVPLPTSKTLLAKKVTSISFSPDLVRGESSQGQEAISQADIDREQNMEMIEREIPIQDLDFSELPHEAFPPAPRISMACPGTLPSQITKCLGAIKWQNPDRFKPATRLRHLEPDERGHWLVETAEWPYKHQHEFWSSLCEHVCSGDFGWGVNLYREPRGSGKMVQRDPRAVGQVCLYCWGEIVEHTWLYLWLCSGGRLSGSGSSWLDADNTAVIQMP